MKYLSLLYIATISFLLLFPFSAVGASNPIGMGEIGDYIAHFIIYLPWMFGGWVIWRDELNIGLWFALGTIFVVGLELLQLASMFRGFNIYDIVVGEMGLIFSYLSLMLYLRLRRK